MLSSVCRLYVVLYLLTMPAVAADKFYPVVDASGNVTVIRSAPDSRAPSDAAGGNKLAEPAASKAAAVSPAKAVPRSVTAPYDSEEFTDAEILEAAAQPGEERKRFYMINDAGPGQLTVQEGNAALTVADDVWQAGPVIPEDFVRLSVQRRERGPEAAQSQWRSVARCQRPPALERLPTIERGGRSDLVIDRQTYAFPLADGVLLARKLGGDGQRMLRVRTFSRVDRRPAFLLPPLALLDVQGCLTRVLQQYADRFYGATPRRHPMLEGEVEIQEGEAYVLFLADGVDETTLPYRVSRYGQLMLGIRNEE